MTGQTNQAQEKDLLEEAKKALQIFDYLMRFPNKADLETSRRLIGEKNIEDALSTARHCAVQVANSNFSTPIEKFRKVLEASGKPEANNVYPEVKDCRVPDELGIHASVATIPYFELGIKAALTYSTLEAYRRQVKAIDPVLFKLKDLFG